MYTAYFGLQQAPFSIAPDPRYLYMSQRHREALAHLVYGLQAGGGFVLLTGDIGSGKTTICRSLLSQIPGHVQLACVFNPKLNAIELLQTVCEEFGLALPEPPDSLKALVTALNGFLLQAHASGRRCVLVIDEAQNLSTDVLEQLRLLTNLETSEHKLLQIILIGQPELRELLERPELEQLAQRVLARYHLQALNQAETRLYIQHRLTIAGLQGPQPFTEPALRRLHRLARGVPRRINLLCDRALLGAYAKRLHRVDVSLVNQAAAEVLGSSPTGPRFEHLSMAAAGLGIFAVVGAAWVSTTDQPAADPTAPMAQNAPPVAAAVAASRQAPPPLASLPTDQNPAWRALGLRWGLRLPEQGICESAQAQRVQCFRTTELTLAGLRQLDRPGLLLLNQNGVSRWVMAEALQADELRLRAGDRQWTLPLDALPRIWRGEYASFWRLPPGQTARVFNASAQDPAGQWLARQLDRLTPGAPKTLDFSARVRAFQQQHGLHGDGRALPSTFLLVNRLAGVDEPRLTTPAPR